MEKAAWLHPNIMGTGQVGVLKIKLLARCRCYLGSGGWRKGAAQRLPGPAAR